jgi:acyl-CoA synthetase (AMP-forming)/AMP-acid ligase II
VLGRAADVATIRGALVTPTAAEDALMRSPTVRVASVVADRATHRWLAAVVAWPGARVDVDACRAALAATLGRRAAAHVVLVPVHHVPLTGQGKPDRPAIARLATATSRALAPSIAGRR